MFLTADEGRLRRFMEATGLDGETLRGRAGEAETLCAILAHLMEDESLLLVFAAHAGREAALIAAAAARLSES